MELKGKRVARIRELDEWHTRVAQLHSYKSHRCCFEQGEERKVDLELPFRLNEGRPHETIGAANVRSALSGGASKNRTAELQLSPAHTRLVSRLELSAKLPKTTDSTLYSTVPGY
jgi:hypothetical protein